MSKLKAIIFDLDGTLADTLPLCISSFQKALEQINEKKYSHAEVTEYFGLTEEGICRSLAGDRWQECLDLYVKIYKENHDLCPSLFDGVKKSLDFIKNNGYKMALVTGKGVHSVFITLDYYGIRNYFEFVETGSNEGLIKDKCLTKILNCWEIFPEEAAYLGDQPTDITCSRKAGVIPIGVAWASTTDRQALEKENPYKIFDKIEEFQDWLESRTNHSQEISIKLQNT